MIRLAQKSIAILVSLTLIGCSTLKLVADEKIASGGSIQRRALLLNTGDKVVLTPKSGLPIELIVTRASAESIEGTTPAGSQSINVVSLEKIERKEVDRMATALLVLTGVLALVGLGQAASGISKLVNPK
jgi:hypothetical protein